jgi:hypothetical protein
VHIDAIAAAVDLRNPQEHQVDEAPAQRALLDDIGNLDQMLESLGCKLEIGNANSVCHGIQSSSNEAATCSLRSIRRTPP